MSFKIRELGPLAFYVYFIEIRQYLTVHLTDLYIMQPTHPIQMHSKYGQIIIEWKFNSLRKTLR